MKFLSLFIFTLRIAKKKKKSYKYQNINTSKNTRHCSGFLPGKKYTGSVKEAASYCKGLNICGMSFGNRGKAY